MINLRLVDSGWEGEFDDAFQIDHSTLRIVCPFIKLGVAMRLLERGKPDQMQVITRFNCRDFCAGVSDIEALRLLLDAGAQVRGVCNLHAKVYLIGARAIVTSANLTNAGLSQNHEFGFVSDDQAIFQRCRVFFDDLWSRSGQDLTAKRLDSFGEEVAKRLATGMRPNDSAGLGDYGANVGIPSGPAATPTWVTEASQAFVKFFGQSRDRASRSMSVLEEVDGSGSHWACTYPKGKRPRQVEDGAIMFIGRFVKQPDDISIYGRAIALKYVEGRDDATSEDIERRKWKAQWPHYVRVHHAEFIGGTLQNGVSLNALMDSLQFNS